MSSSSWLSEIFSDCQTLSTEGGEASIPAYIAIYQGGEAFPYITVQGKLSYQPAFTMDGPTFKGAPVYIRAFPASLTASFDAWDEPGGDTFPEGTSMNVYVSITLPQTSSIPVLQLDPPLGYVEVSFVNDNEVLYQSLFPATASQAQVLYGTGNPLVTNAVGPVGNFSTGVLFVVTLGLPGNA